MSHIPVLLKEVIDYLNPRPNQDFIDATFGAGGHTRALLERTAPEGRVLALDADDEVGEKSSELLNDPKLRKRLVFRHGNFSMMGDIAKETQFSKISGILFDLGLSSTLLDNPERGFSFQKSGPLDMRFDRIGQKKTAADLINTTGERYLEKIFREYGEEKFSKKISRAIVNIRKNREIENTTDLFNIIKTALPAKFRHKSGDVARRIFQALRIELNSELEDLKKALEQADLLLMPGGRIAVISFHSLEDRIVKRFFQTQANPCICPPEFPKCLCERIPSLKIITRKPVIPGSTEISANPRSKSAKLRVAEKL